MGYKIYMVKHGQDMQGIKACIFDLDGTLVKTQNEFHAAAEVKVLERCGISLTPEAISSRFSGIHTLEVFKELAPSFDPQKLFEEKWKLIYSLASRQPIELVPFAGELVRRLHGQGVTLAIASASPLAWIETCLKKTRLNNFFHSLASADEVRRGKPAPDVFLLAAKRLGAHPGECIAIDDGRAGVIAGVSAGMRTYWLTENSGEVAGSIKIYSLKEILVLIN